MGARVWGGLSFGVNMVRGSRDRFWGAVIQSGRVLCLTFRAVCGAKEGGVRRYVPQARIEQATARVSSPSAS